MPWRIEKDHVVISIRLTPKGGGDRIEGISQLSDGGQVLTARVSAAPDRGAANRALMLLLAEFFNVPKSAVSFTTGETARLKKLRVDGDPRELVARLRSLAGA